MPRGSAVATKIVPKYIISLYYAGCVNRPFYPLVVFPHRNPPHKVHNWEGTVIEQIGAFDPIANARNEKLVAVNFERVAYWLAKDAILTRAAAELLGLSGYLPLHPHTFIRAQRARAAKPIFTPPVAEIAEELPQQSSSTAADDDEAVNSAAIEPEEEEGKSRVEASGN